MSANVAKCNLGEVNLESMRPAVFPTYLRAVWPRGLPWVFLSNQSYSPSTFCFAILADFSVDSLANLPPCPSHPR